MSREVLPPGSPTSKKRQALDVAKKLKKRKPTLLEGQMENVIVDSDHDKDGTDTDIGGSFHTSPRMDTSIKLAIEEACIPDVNTHVSNKDVNINSGEQPSTSIPKKTKVTPPEVLHTKSVMEEGEIPNITVNLFDKEKNVNKSEGRSKIETSIVVTSTTLPPSLTSPPQTYVIPPTSITAFSSTFDVVMQEPITTLFSS